MIRGFLFSGIKSGIKKEGLDLGLIYIPQGACSCGFFTKNVNSSYSVRISKRHIKNKIFAVLVNSGNANCFTHKEGLNDTLKLTEELAKYLKIKKENVLIASTGIIGRKLPFSKIIKKIPLLVRNLKKDPTLFSRSILTTDTFPKKIHLNLDLGKKKVNLLGIAKGAGMIFPHLATMLAFILTDAKIEKKLLRGILKKAVEESFNKIFVDGCTSTNDSVFFLSSLEGEEIKNEKEIKKFLQALIEVCQNLAKMIVKDGEGATKFVNLKIEEAKTEKEAKKAFWAISNSVLFRSSLYGGIPNWGRIVASLGQVGIKLEEERFKVESSDLKRKEIEIKVKLGRGRSFYQGWCCDISPSYVKINSK